MHKTVVRRSSRFAAVLGVAVLTGASAAAAASPQSAPPGSGGEASGTPIKIGLAYSETGRAGVTYNQTDSVAQAWAQWVNSEGGINGHPVEIVLGDTKGDAAEAATAGRELVENDGVVAVVVQDTVTESALAGYLVSQGVPYIGGSAQSYSENWPNIYFNMATNNPANAASAIIAAQSAGYSSFGAAVCAEVPACAEAGTLFEGISAQLGVGYAGLVTVGASEPSYTAPCLELIGNGADFVYLGLTSATALSLIEECATQGYTGAWAGVTTTVQASQFEDVEGLVMGGSLNGFPWWADAPPVQQFRDVMEEFAPDADYRSPAPTSTWAALELFRKALTDNGPAADEPVAASDVLAAYYQVSDETLDGLLPQPITFTEGTTAQPRIDCFWLFLMEDGEFGSLQAGESGNGAEGDLQSSCFTM